MKPPICELCDERLDAAQGALLNFIGDERSVAWRRDRDADGRVGHPPDVGWFCALHAESARLLVAGATLGDALTALRSDESIAIAFASGPAEDGDSGRSAVGGQRSPAAASDTSGSGAQDDRAVPSTQRRRFGVDMETVVTRPTPMTVIEKTFERFLDDLIAEAAQRAGTLVDRTVDDISTKVAQYDSPEWRERGPASEERTTITVTRIESWEYVIERRVHEWLSGGLIQSSCSVAVRSSAGHDQTLPSVKLSAGRHAGSPVDTMTVIGQAPRHVAAKFASLIEGLRPERNRSG